MSDKSNGNYIASQSPTTLSSPHSIASILSTDREIESFQQSTAMMPALSERNDGNISGLDMMAHVASAINPIPVIPKKMASTSSSVREERNNIIQSIYQHQQSLRAQQMECPISLPSKPPNKLVLEPLAGRRYFLPSMTKSALKKYDNDSLTSIVATKVSKPRRPSITVDGDSHSVSSKSQNGTSSYRRNVHNICEKRRRENIRGGFDTLQASLPPSLASNPRISKQEVLLATIAILTESKQRISALQRDIAILEAERSRILRK